MANKIPMEFKLGDKQFHYFQMETSAWAAGGKLWFAAKPQVDNDVVDGAAVINKSFNDTKIVGALHPEYTAGYTTYELQFDPGDITGVTFVNGEKSKKYLGEFEFVSASAEPQSFPSDDQFIEVTIFADIKRGIA